LDIVIVFFEPLRDWSMPSKGSNVHNIKMITSDQLVLPVIPAPARLWCLSTHMRINELVRPIHPCYQCIYVLRIFGPYFEYARDPEFLFVGLAINLEIWRADIYVVELSIVFFLN
jgi:hypothetical protein